MQLNYITKKLPGGCEFTKSQEKITNLIYMEDILTFAKNVNKRETIIQKIKVHIQDIRMEFDIEKWAMFLGESEERNKTHNQNAIKPFGQKEKL